VGGYFAVRWRPPDFKRINSYHALFYELLGHSPDVKADLKELGLPQSLARYAGSDGYTNITALNDPHIDEILDKATPARLTAFYARHPTRAKDLFSRGIVAMSDPVVHYLGNYPYAPGEQASTTCRFCLASNGSRGTRDYAQWVFAAVWIAEIGVAAAGLRRRQDRDTRALAGALVLALVVTAVSLATALLGDGDYELIKHLYLADAANFLAIVFTVGTVVRLWSNRRRQAEPERESAAADPAEPVDPPPANPNPFADLMARDTTG
jgi:hypothetical protein